METMKFFWMNFVVLVALYHFTLCRLSEEMESVLRNATGDHNSSVFGLDSLPTNLKDQFFCFSCTASSLGEDQPNANCTEPLDNFYHAVTKGVDVTPCETKQCYTDVIRLGDYLSVFRGCRQHNEDLVSFKIHNYDSYNCTRLTLLGKAMWWSCSCESALCNNQLPPV